MTDSSSNRIMLVEPWVRCFNCGAPINVVDDYFAQYFSSSAVACPSCAFEVDWWEQVLYEIRDNFMGNLAYSAIGARTSIGKVYLRAGQSTRVNFMDFGVPDEAKLLHVNYTPQSGLFPIEMHGNVPVRHSIPSILHLWPRPSGTLPDGGIVEVNVSITWVTYAGNEYTWQSLVDGFEAYISGRYNYLLVPANVAVEFSLNRLLSDAFERVAGKERTKEFLDRGATYSHQLNVLLPLLIDTKGLPLLSNHLRGLLNSLRDYRNQIAHRGVLDDGPLEHDRAANLICAALFGFRYLELAHNRLQPTSLDG